MFLGIGGEHGGFRFCENRDMRRFITIGGIVLCVKKAPKRRIFSGYEGDKKDVSGNDETGRCFQIQERLTLKLRPVNLSSFVRKRFLAEVHFSGWEKTISGKIFSKNFTFVAQITKKKLHFCGSHACRSITDIVGLKKRTS